MSWWNSIAPSYVGAVEGFQPVAKEFLGFTEFPSCENTGVMDTLALSGGWLQGQSPGECIRFLPRDGIMSTMFRFGRNFRAQGQCTH